MITAEQLAQRMAGIEPIGRAPDGATTRLAWTREDAAARAWFAQQAQGAGLTVQRDPAGNLWATPAAPGPWWAVGSHLDSVRDGGRYDGALGVAAAFAVAAGSAHPVAVISFADEEGARFNTPTFGSRALTGALDVADALARVDQDGVSLRDALRDDGVDPDGLVRAPAWLDRLRGFVELHIDQTRDLAVAGVAAGPVARLAARTRLQLRLDGQADHAGTTPRDDRRDALMAAARIVVAGDDAARQRPEMRFTPARIEVDPNVATTIARQVRLWVDARAPEPIQLQTWVDAFSLEAARVAAAHRVRLDLRTASFSPGTTFDQAVFDGLARHLPAAAPGLVCFAGHDAGIVAAARPAGMAFVRNHDGISHAPQEDVSLQDAATGADAIRAFMEDQA
ncbi:Zn-dependent hydrolase [Conexibacter sp. CPCC 206217]|uniref:Zn-dependent hydrolase n=1 Tax=Conexibacter sp. CPCC 206217 TaxID=3064574 RepID=UPI0027290DA1|nr:Zn-dependent hydrolase [Conexibacter sp. CPCC 206217]MDO8209732.1 Zn-dependent hydrolase [Conexibacter sp. CPCC 206217]